MKRTFFLIALLLTITNQAKTQDKDDSKNSSVEYFCESSEGDIIKFIIDPKKEIYSYEVEGEAESCVLWSKQDFGTENLLDYYNMIIENNDEDEHVVEAVKKTRKWLLKDNQKNNGLNVVCSDIEGGFLFSKDFKTVRIMGHYTHPVDKLKCKQ
jgi:hypothetical protein